MKARGFLRDASGSTAVEFGLTVPVFLSALTGAFGCSLVLWTQLGLQHAVEMAARCASVNTTVCDTVSATQNYAANEAFGLNLPASVFSVSTQPCGNQVTATYPFPVLFEGMGLPAVTLTGQACFPK